MEKYVLKGSKYIIKCIVILSIIIVIPCIIGEGIIVGNLIKKSTNNDDLLGDIVALIGIGLFVLAFIIADIVVLIQYKYSEVILTNTKLIMVYNDNEKFEIPYSNIEKVTMGYLTTLIYCKESFRNKGWNKGAKTFSCNCSIEEREILSNVIKDYNINSGANIIIE